MSSERRKTSKEQPAIPACLYVSGCSLLLAGFNGEYVRDCSKDIPMWRRARSVFLGIPILPTVIKQHNGRWRLCTDDGESECWYSLERDPTGLPIGWWKSGIFVSTVPNLVGDSLRSYGTPFFCASLFAGLSLFLATKVIPPMVTFVANHYQRELIVPVWAMVSLCVFLILCGRV
jgi:hypothetical protein